MARREADARRTLETLPNLPQAHSDLGVVLSEGRRLGEAEAAFRHAISLQSKDVTALYNLGVVLAATNRSQQAEAAYRSAITHLPNFVEAHNNLGVLLMEAKRLDEAESSFRRALELNPGFFEAKKNLTIVLDRASRNAKVEQEYRQQIERTPESVDAHNALGVFLSDSKRFAEAESSFRRSLELQPDNVVALCNLGSILFDTKRQWEAETQYRRALEVRPDFAEASYNLGLALAGTKRLPEAQAAFRRVIELQPDNYDAYLALGVALLDSQRPMEAEAALRQAVALKPDREAAKLDLEFVGNELKRLSATEAVLRREADLKPEIAATRYRLGLTLMALGKPEDAAAAFRQVLAIEPQQANAHHQRGVCLMRQGQLDAAIACYEQALSIKPDFADAMANIGTAYFLKADYDQAVAWNERALRVDPKHVDANTSMALILLKQRQPDAAQQHLDRASPGQTLSIEYAANPVRSVLLLWTKKAGNIPTTEFLFPQTINTRVNWVLESERNDLSGNLPDYDLVFNGMGDPDLIGEAVGPLNRFAAACTRPLLNPPDKVARTARHLVPALLKGIDDLVVPPVWRFADSSEWDDSIVKDLPLMVRPVEKHGGEGLVLATTEAELSRCRAAQKGPVYVTRFVDFRSPDSWFRKYRIIFIDRKPYPYHLAISKIWIVHYWNADMQSHPWKLKEEEAFLRDPEQVLGSANMRAVEAIGARMDLEYAGMDLSLTGDKRVLLFEANPTMLVHSEDLSTELGHKNEHAFRIQRAFEELLQRIESQQRLRA